MNVQDIKAFKSNVLLEMPRQIEQTTKAGLILPTNSTKNGRLVSAKVLSVGEKVIDVAEGDRVLFYPKSGDSVWRNTDANTELYLIPEGHIIAVLEDGEEFAVDVES